MLHGFPRYDTISDETTNVIWCAPIPVVVALTTTMCPIALTSREENS